MEIWGLDGEVKSPSLSAKGVCSWKAVGQQFWAPVSTLTASFPSVVLKACGEAEERNHTITNYCTKNTMFVFSYGNYSVGRVGGDKYIYELVNQNW